MALTNHLNIVLFALSNQSPVPLQQQFSLSSSPALTALVFDSSLENGAADIRRAISPLDINWSESLSQRWRAAYALYREGDIISACNHMGQCVS
jgi:hypothetical protein